MAGRSRWPVALLLTMLGPSGWAGACFAGDATEWSGPYLGGSAALGFGHVGSSGNIIYGGQFIDVPPVAPAARAVTTPGYLLGPRIGERWRFGRLLVGAEADAAVGNIAHENTVSGRDANGVPFVQSTRSGLDWLSTLRGSVGFSPLDHLLAYATGGFAVGEVNDGTALSFPTTRYVGASAAVRPGWVAGAGIAYALGGRWAVTLEYRHTDLGQISVVGERPEPSYFHSQADFSPRFDTIALGLDYALTPAGGGAPASGPPAFLQGVSYEIGTRSWFALGSLHYKLYDPTGASLVSRLTYGGVAGNTGEVFGRIAHPTGVFLKGMVGIGGSEGGNLKDVDVPPYTVPPSATYSRQRGGSLQYGAIDLGFDVLETSRLHLGPFVGYGYVRDQMNAYGCAQTGGNTAICPPGAVAPGALVIAENAAWHVARLGLAGDGAISERLHLGAEAAWVPFGGLSGTDTHWLRLNTPGDLTAAQTQAGRAHGVQIEAALRLRISEAISLSAGGRFWRFDAPGKTRFTSADGPSVQPTKFSAVRYGPFVQASIAY